MSTVPPVLQNFIGGSYVGPTDGRTSPVVDPSTGEAYAQAPISSAQDVAAAMTVVTGGRRIGDRGYFVQPTVVAGPQQRDEMIQDEVSGPVITVQQFTDEDVAVRWANDVRFGLSASVWTHDHGRATRVSRRLDFGAVWISTHLPFVSEMPHGGYGHSGYGKGLSMYGFEEYTRIKHVMSYLG